MRSILRFFFNARFATGFATGLIGGIAALYVLAIFVLPALREYARAKVEETLKPPVLPTTDANYDWTLTTLEGREKPFTDFKGKTVFLLIWNPLCDICVAELPHVQTLFEQIGDEVEFAAVAVVNKDEEIIKYIADYDLRFPIYTFEGDRPDIYNVGAVPATFVIAPDGKLVFRYRGAARWDDDSFVQYLRGIALTTTSEAITAASE